MCYYDVRSVFCQVKQAGGGFGGRGFKFDDTEEQLCVDRKKLQKASLGMHDSDDEDGGKDIDQQISDMFAEKKAVREVSRQFPFQCFFLFLIYFLPIYSLFFWIFAF